MAQTTTQISACDVVIKLDNDTPLLADISGSSNKATMNRSTLVSDAIRTFGSTFPVRQACGKDAEINLTVLYSTDEAESMQILNDWYENHSTDTRNLQIDIPDSNPGSDRYSYVVYLAELNMDVESGTPDPVLVEAILRPTGTFTWAQVAS